MLVLDFKTFDVEKPQHGEVCLTYNLGNRSDFKYQVGKYNAYLRLFQLPAFWCDNGNCKDMNGSMHNTAAWASLKGK